jgi:hypothetical protein
LFSNAAGDPQATHVGGPSWLLIFLRDNFEDFPGMTEVIDKCVATLLGDKDDYNKMSAVELKTDQSKEHPEWGSKIFQSHNYWQTF